VDFADEIILGENPIITKNFINNSDFDLISNPTKSKIQSVEKFSQNYLLSFSLVSFSFIATLILFTKIASTTFININNLISSLFVLSYFALFIFSIFLISRRKILSLKVKGHILHIKSFPSLNEKIPINQILKCELNSMNKDKFTATNRKLFALNEDGNRYKLPLTSGIALQLIDGNHILIGSSKS